jgi:hypothetical protein
MWGARFGRGFGSGVRHNTKWMNVFIDVGSTKFVYLWLRAMRQRVKQSK